VTASRREKNESEDKAKKRKKKKGPEHFVALKIWGYNNTRTNRVEICNKVEREVELVGTTKKGRVKS